jgi:hypothetical protein
MCKFNDRKKRGPVVLLEVFVKTYDSLLMFSSERLDLGLEQEVVDVEGNIGNSKDEDLDSE